MAVDHVGHQCLCHRRRRAKVRRPRTRCDCPACSSSSSFSVMRLHSRPTISSKVDTRMPSRLAASLRSMSYCTQRQTSPTQDLVTLFDRQTDQRPPPELGLIGFLKDRAGSDLGRRRSEVALPTLAGVGLVVLARLRRPHVEGFKAALVTVGGEPASPCPCRSTHSTQRRRWE